jgi:restriction system protein
MKPAGFVESGGRGVWVLTDLGRQAADWTAAKVKKASADAYRALAAARKEAPTAELEATSDAPDWKDSLLASLRAIDPGAFERLCQRVLRESGFVKVEVTGKSGDGGIDGIGVLRVNLISFQVLFQCKRYSGSSVTPAQVRDFRGAMQGRADKGLFITTGGFTAEARREATRDGAPAIDLIDGEALCLLLKELKLGVIVKPVLTEEILVDTPFLAAI